MDDGLIELLILVAIAGGVLFYLRSIIGTRTGHEGTPQDRFGGMDQAESAGDNVTPMRPVPFEDDPEVVKNLDEASIEALQGMRQAEPDFDLQEFVMGARQAYEMILMAYEEGDRDTLKSLLTPDVYSAFERGIADRAEKGLRVEARFIGVRDVRAENVMFDDEMAEADVVLRFVGEMITAVRDSENRVVEGDPNEIRRQTDVWTFSRVMGSQNPNWLLTATSD